jgi:hypothetical protein
MDGDVVYDNPVAVPPDPPSHALELRPLSRNKDVIVDGEWSFTPLGSLVSPPTPDTTATNTTVATCYTTATIATAAATPLTPPKLSKVWVSLVLVSQIFLLLIHMEASVVPYPTEKWMIFPDVTHSEGCVMIRYVCIAAMPCYLLLLMLVLLHDPSSPLGLPQLLSSAVACASRCLLAKSPPGILTDHGYLFSYGYLYVAEALLWSVFLQTACYKRCRLLNSFPQPQTPTFVFKTLPTVVFSTITMLLFVFGESVSCLSEKARDGIPDNMQECDDVINSNFSLSNWFMVMAGTQLLVFPFVKSSYTVANLVRFDFTFGEQAQILLMVAALGVSIFAFASSLDSPGKKDSEMMLFESYSARMILNLCKFFQRVHLFLTRSSSNLSLTNVTNTLTLATHLINSM